jgi:predicted membrane-bound mannosyltransferase
MPLLILSAIGTAAALVKRSRFAVFAGAWAFSLLAAYSILPYKTPWILVNVTLPMCIVAGYLTQGLWDRASLRLGSAWRRRVPALALIAVAFGMCAYRSIWLNFFHYDDLSSAYVYVQTHRGFLDLISRIEQIAQESGTGVATHMTVATPEYWPLPWYLRDYKNVGYFGRVVPTETPIVIGSKKQEAELRAMLPLRYRLAGSYPLRPGVELVLFLASDQRH